MSPRVPAAPGTLLLRLALAAPAPAQDGVQHLEYSFGPVEVGPGRNTIAIEANDQRPAVDGWIVGFRPNLVRADGSVPRVDVIHLHHGVWISNYGPLFAAGEEKAAMIAPPGYGWRYRTTDRWRMNHIIHNLTPDPDDVHITYEIDFIPDGAPDLPRARRRGVVGRVDDRHAARMARERDEDRDRGLRLRPGRPRHDRQAPPAGAGAQGPPPDVRQPRRPANRGRHGV